MAAYTITYACGCERTVNIHGSLKERERKKTWLEKQTCLACKRKSDHAAAAKISHLEKPPLALIQKIEDDEAIEVVVFRSFPIKDQLKSRRYFYYGKDASEYRMPDETQTQGPPDPVWARSFMPDELHEEFTYLSELGCTVQFHGLSDNIVTAITEDRPDLLPETNKESADEQDEPLPF